MISKWCHHVRQQRASVSFTQRNIFTKRTTRALWTFLSRQAKFKFWALWSVRDGKGIIPPVRAYTTPPHPCFGVRPCEVSAHCSNTAESQCCHHYKYLMRKSRIVIVTRSVAGGCKSGGIRRGWMEIYVSLGLSLPFPRTPIPPYKSPLSPPTKTLPHYLSLSFSFVRNSCICKLAVRVRGREMTQSELYLPLASHPFHCPPPSDCSCSPIIPMPVHCLPLSVAIHSTNSFCPNNFPAVSKPRDIAVLPFWFLIHLTTAVIAQSV